MNNKKELSKSIANTNGKLDQLYKFLQDNMLDEINRISDSGFRYGDSDVSRILANIVRTELIIRMAENIKEDI